MGVYVSEINMPKGEDSKLVLQIFPNGEVYDVHGIRLGIANWAEAVPVPEHGDLIDRDAATKKIWDDMRFPSNLANAQFFVNELREMPTIIPADKEGEG